MRVMRDMSFEDYVALDGINASLLKKVTVSPRYAKWTKDNPDNRDTPSTRIGRAVHVAVLEPDELPKRYVVWTGGRRYGKAWNEFKEENEGKEILTEPEFEQVGLMSSAVANDPEAKKLVTGGAPEVSIEWGDPRTGARCKCRLDYLHDDFVPDLKTTVASSIDQFQRMFVQHGYDIQAAFYADAVGYVLGPRPMKVLVVQNKPPYDVMVFDIGDDMIEFGRHRYEKALDKLLACKAQQEWPGVSGGNVMTLHAPAWAMAEMDDDDGPLELTMGDKVVARF